MKNLKISGKLIATTLAMTLVSIVIGIAGIMGMTMMRSASQQMYEKQTATIPEISKIVNNVERLQGLARDYILYINNRALVDRIDAEIAQTMDEYRELTQKYAPTIENEESQRLFDEAATLFESEFAPKLAYIGENTRAYRTSVVTLENQALQEIGGKIATNFSTCMQNRIQTAEQMQLENVRTANFATVAIAAVMIGGVVASIMWGLYLARSMSKPVIEMVNAAKQLAQGELDVKITYKSKDEIGQLAVALRSAMQTLKGYVADISLHLDLMARGDMTQGITEDYIGDFSRIKEAFETILSSLNRTLYVISDSSEQINGGAEQLSSGSQMLAQGAAEQASAIEELSASISEVAEKAKQNVSSVEGAGNFINDVLAQVGQSNEKMQQLLTSIADLNASSTQIGKIIKVIDDIAFQTNILALNAAVEAARAGEAGKGFAVVAGEVRSLASRSADAAKQTADLIEASVTAIGGSTKIAEETARSLEAAARKMKDVDASIAQVDQASSMQSVAIEQITQGVEQISVVVQNNAATAAKSAASSEELTSMAAMLREEAAKFRLKGQAYEAADKADDMDFDQTIEADETQQSQEPFIQELPAADPQVSAAASFTTNSKY